MKKYTKEEIKIAQEILDEIFEDRKNKGID